MLIYVGSPLNRVSFLRTDRNFLTDAFNHPSATFVLLNNLCPLARDPAHLSFVQYKVVQTLIPQNPFEKSEEQLVADYDSSVTVPCVLFLGLDESRQDGGFQYGQYKGAPCFAVDITPRGSYEDKADEIVNEVTKDGSLFMEGRTHQSFPASEGMKCLWHNAVPAALTLHSGNICAGTIYS